MEKNILIPNFNNDDSVNILDVIILVNWVLDVN
jgi:hypothetical protein